MIRKIKRYTINLIPPETVVVKPLFKESFTVIDKYKYQVYKYYLDNINKLENKIKSL